MRFDEWQDSNGVPVASGAGGVFTAPGNVLQVVSVNETTNFTTTSTSDVNVTGYSVSITPTSASSKIFIFVNANADCNQLLSAFMTLRRDTTDLFEENKLTLHANGYAGTFSFAFSETSGSTSARTYLLRYRLDRLATSIILNGSITVMEVAG
jgi:hypothetical protein